MDVKLEKADASDSPVLHEMQKAAFWPLLEKYKDVETSPAAETLERVTSRITHREGVFCKIWADGKLAGAINIKWKEDERFWIGPLFVLPEYQGKGIAQEAMRQAEVQHPQAKSWELATLLEERGNCYLYEKMGFSKTGKYEKLNHLATLVYYRKSCGHKL
ncbi:GNAT family N-acetyltransferase [Planococcus sp. YIM B11945]|uniref:GNAT family N-acetyltransferase n=1 Tax=Planococcus sp. YIM B11945 TaxID=3435410 RepID=UPI003D7CD615